MAKKEYTKRQWNELVKQWNMIDECQFIGLAKKFILKELASLSMKKGYCFASNQWLADKWTVTKNNIETHISDLHRMGFIKTEKVFRQRRITIDWYIVEKRKSEKKRGSHYAAATIKYFGKVLGEEGVPEWREDRKLMSALNEYIGACKKNELRLQVGDVPEQVQFLIRESGGDVRKAVDLIDAAIDDERKIC